MDEYCDHARDILKFCQVNDEEKISETIREMKQYLERESLHAVIVVIM